jgi:hypothetical protein
MQAQNVSLQDTLEKKDLSVLPISYCENDVFVTYASQRAILYQLSSTAEAQTMYLGNP